jgi:hypothetical protein
VIASQRLAKSQARAAPPGGWLQANTGVRTEFMRSGPLHPSIRQFLDHLEAERNSSEHTVRCYEDDLTQFEGSRPG